jgi:hypothetical protein
VDDDLYKESKMTAPAANPAELEPISGVAH